MAAAFKMQLERIARDSSIASKILAHERRTDAFEIGRKLAGHIAAIKIVEPRMGELIERIRELLGAPYRPALRKLAVDEKPLGKSRRLFQRLELERLALGFRARLRIALAAET